jgi:hypothetical protein
VRSAPESEGTTFRGAEICGGCCDSYLEREIVRVIE